MKNLLGLRTLPYTGGKHHFYGPGSWIAKCLNVYQCDTYVEPFCGCLGILLKRSPVKLEIVNDLDDRIVNFFRVVRDEPHEFAERMLLTCTRSRREFEWAKENIDTCDLIDRALSVFIILRNGMPSSLIPRSVYVSGSSRGEWLPQQVFELATRLANVRIECTDAVNLIDRVKSKSSSTLIYCDPPYTDTLGYSHEVDARDFVRSITEDVSSDTVIAVSGYENNWSELERHGYCRSEMTLQERSSRARSKRVECLWIKEH